MIKENDMKETEFIATLKNLNQITFPARLREKFDVVEGEELLLEFKGKISKRVIKPKIENKEEKQND